MADYYLTPEVMPAIRRQVLNRLLKMGSLALIGGFCYSYFVLKAETSVALSSSGMLLGVVLFSYFYSVKQQQALAASYRLLITPTGITRVQAPLPPIQLASTEITSITQNRAGVLTIATTDQHRAIYVPVYISNRAELLNELATHAPLTVPDRKTLIEKLSTYTGLATLALISVFYSVDNKWVSTIAGTLVLGILAWSGWHIWRNPNLPPQVRRMRWFLPVVVLSIIVGIIARLTPN
jgi:uncharacterized membrane protein YgdD (TMEM256/DUF423 family)